MSNLELDRNSSKPLYAQLDDILRSAIINQEWEVGHAIPSEFELSRKYNISRMTVRAVVTQLVNDGLLYRVQGKGTFVAEPKIKAKSLAYRGLRAQLEEMGYNTNTHLVDHAVISASTHLARLMGINVGDEVIYLKRVRYANTTPISVHNSYLSKKLVPFLPDELLETEELCVLLDNMYELKPARISETLSSILATEEYAELLLVEPRWPLLALEDIICNSNGQVYEYSKVVFRGDKITLHFDV